MFRSEACMWYARGDVKRREKPLTQSPNEISSQNFMVIGEVTHMAYELEALCFIFQYRTQTHTWHLIISPQVWVHTLPSKVCNKPCQTIGSDITDSPGDRDASRREKRTNTKPSEVPSSQNHMVIGGITHLTCKLEALCFVFQCGTQTHTWHLIAWTWHARILLSFFFYFFIFNYEHLNTSSCCLSLGDNQPIRYSDH